MEKDLKKLGIYASSESIAYLQSTSNFKFYALILL
jgi:hypothetical protein